MPGNDIPAAVVEDMLLSVEQLTELCAVTPDWVALHVREGALACTGETADQWRFTSRDVWRVRHIHALERDFDAVPELAALVADLLEELDAMRGRLRRAGL